MKEGRLETESTGNNTQATLNFRPTLDREFLVNGYRELMKELYEPRNYYQRIRTFLEHNRPRGPRLRIVVGLPGLCEVLVAARGLAPRAPGLLAILRHDVAQAASPVPFGRTRIPRLCRTGNHRSAGITSEVPPFPLVVGSVHSPKFSGISHEKGRFCRHFCWHVNVDFLAICT
jgi:hypothetical protein